jgi:hypothetical protein
MLKFLRGAATLIVLVFLASAPFQGAAQADLQGGVDCPPNEPSCDLSAGDGGDDPSDSPPNGDDGDEGGQPPGSGEGPDCTGPIEELPVECLPEGEMAPIGDLAAQARDRLVLPGPEFAASPGERQLVHLPVWLAVDESSWRSVSASVTAGSVTVTATAEPSRAEWDLGDGTVVVCEGPGTQWTPADDPEGESPDCGYTYTRSAAEVDVTATVFWTVTWASTIGTGGTFADVATSTADTWEVAESRSVIVR